MEVNFEGKTFTISDEYVGKAAISWVCEDGSRFLPISEQQEVYLDLVEYLQLRKITNKSIARCLRA